MLESRKREIREDEEAVPSQPDASARSDHNPTRKRGPARSVQPGKRGQPPDRVHLRGLVPGSGFGVGRGWLMRGEGERERPRLRVGVGGSLADAAGYRGVAGYKGMVGHKGVAGYKGVAGWEGAWLTRRVFLVCA